MPWQIATGRNPGADTCHGVSTGPAGRGVSPVSGTPLRCLAAWYRQSAVNCGVTANEVKHHGKVDREPELPAVALELQPGSCLAISWIRASFSRLASMVSLNRLFPESGILAAADRCHSLGIGNGLSIPGARKHFSAPQGIQHLYRGRYEERQVIGVARAQEFP